MDIKLKTIRAHIPLILVEKCLEMIQQLTLFYDYIFFVLDNSCFFPYLKVPQKVEFFWHWLSCLRWRENSHLGCTLPLPIQRSKMTSKAIYGLFVSRFAKQIQTLPVRPLSCTQKKQLIMVEKTTLNKAFQIFQRRQLCTPCSLSAVLGEE